MKRDRSEPLLASVPTSCWLTFEPVERTLPGNWAFLKVPVAIGHALGLPTDGLHLLITVRRGRTVSGHMHFNCPKRNLPMRALCGRVRNRCPRVVSTDRFSAARSVQWMSVQGRVR